MDDGGPAFPANHFDLVEGEHGMSLRDYFAAQAMKGMLSNPKLEKQIIRQGPWWIELSAYGWADAMLKARKQ